MSSLRVLDAIMQTALASTGAQGAWILSPHSESELVVIAATGDLSATTGQTLEPDSTFAGFVLASVQPVAMRPRPGDERLAAVRGLLGHEPRSVVSVPCAGEDDVLAVLELIDKHGGSFDFDDVETATMLAQVAAAALVESEHAETPPSPEELAARLQRLAEVSPDRYVRVAVVVQTILAAQ